jgi:uncharacterized membrane protein YjgN (DUF898 family)
MKSWETRIVKHADESHVIYGVMAVMMTPTFAMFDWISGSPPTLAELLTGWLFALVFLFLWSRGLRYWAKRIQARHPAKV